MNKLIPFVAFAAIVATPAFARTRTPDPSPGPFAYQDPLSGPVEIYGKVVGQDPDANVRLQLRRTAGAGHD